MVKHTQTIRQQQPTNCLSVFNHFVLLVLKGLTLIRRRNVLRKFKLNSVFNGQGGQWSLSLFMHLVPLYTP